MAQLEPTQAMLDESQAALDLLINRARLVSNWACNNGHLDQRDSLKRAQAHLLMAQAELGQLSFPGDITTQSGGK